MSYGNLFPCRRQRWPQTYIPGTIGGAGTSKFTPLAVFNGKLYFGGRTTPADNNLMMYNGGTAAIVANVGKPSGQVPQHLSVIGNKLYFVSDTAGAFNILCYYDGTNPPVQIHDLSDMSSSSYPAFAAYLGKVYFSGVSGSASNELYAYDPATGQTVLVADIWPGNVVAGSPHNGNPSRFLVAGSKLYFTARDSAFGMELYNYDGVTVKRLTDVRTGTANGIPIGATNIAFYRGAIFFAGYNSSASNIALFKYDTATQQTTMVYNVNPGGDGGIANLYASPNNLYFIGKTTSAGVELWKYNGAVCSMVADLNPGTGGGIGQSNMLAVTQGFLFFNGNNGTTGNELYKLFDAPGATGNTGVLAAGWSGEVNLYPNPATSSAMLAIAVQSPQSVRIVLTDMQGREAWASALLLLQAGKHEVAVPMQGLAAGQYFYRLSNEAGRMLACGAVAKE